MFKQSALAIALCSVASLAAQAAGLVVGGPADAATGNCLPFGCQISEYQQVYSAAQFAGPITINSLTFYNTQYTAGQVLNAGYDIHLSTTSAAVDGLSSNFASNLGANNSEFAVYAGGALASPSFTITGSSFVYDPSQGNLLMDIVQTNPGGGVVFLDARNGTANGVFSRMVGDGWGGTDGYGLVTGFNVSAVPEPASAALLGLGALVMLGVARRRRG